MAAPLVRCRERRCNPVADHHEPSAWPFRQDDGWWDDVPGARARRCTWLEKSGMGGGWYLVCSKNGLSSHQFVGHHCAARCESDGYWQQTA